MNTKEPRKDDAVQVLIRKLTAATNLTEADKRVLEGVRVVPRYLAAGQEIIAQGEPPSDVHLIVQGLAHRYKILPRGHRQIVAVMVPGDFCDLHSAILHEMDHSVGALTACTVMDIPRATILDLIENHPRITSALRWSTLVDGATLREWITNLGRRQAPERIAHLFCELLVRFQVVGLADANSYAMPIRQVDLADMLALTPVHINRILQTLRGEGLVELKQRHLTIPNVDRLIAFCDFDPTYLHIRPPTAETQEWAPVQ